jgi:hypothetical protein
MVPYKLIGHNHKKCGVPSLKWLILEMCEMEGPDGKDHISRELGGVILRDRYYHEVRL